MQDVIERSKPEPCFGSVIQKQAGMLASKAAESSERFHALVADVREELRNEMKKALGGERQFVPSYTINVNGQKTERLIRIHDAVMEALEHQGNPAVLMSMMSGAGAHVVNLITLREGVIDAYVDLNAEAVAQARWERRQ